MTKIVATSDLHGKLPKPKTMPAGDILLIAGDITPTTDHSIEYQRIWLDSAFRYWLSQLSYKHVICVFGNHDFIGEQNPYGVEKLNLPCKFLTDEEVTVEGLRIYGTPHQPYFFGWAFNLYEPKLREKWDLIPQGIDILVSHGPPQGYGDLTEDHETTGKIIHVGSPSLTLKIEEIKPKLVVYGHIHSGYNTYTNPNCPNTILANVAYVNEKYQPANDPMVFEL